MNTTLLDDETRESLYKADKDDLAIFEMFPQMRRVYGEGGKRQQVAASMAAYMNLHDISKSGISKCFSRFDATFNPDILRCYLVMTQSGISGISDVTGIFEKDVVNKLLSEQSRGILAYNGFDLPFEHYHSMAKGNHIRFITDPSLDERFVTDLETTLIGKRELIFPAERKIALLELYGNRSAEEIAELKKNKQVWDEWQRTCL